jgi:Cytochrome oxidase complex assembly protein 1
VVVPSRARRNALILGCVLAFPVTGLLILFYFRDSGRKRAIAESAIYRAQTSSQLAAMIGLPMQPGWPVRGTVVSRNGSGNADLRIVLTGSRGEGTLFEWAQQEGGKWQICSLSFHSSAGADLTLVDAAGTHCEPE